MHQDSPYLILSSVQTLGSISDVRNAQLNNRVGVAKLTYVIQM